MDDAIPTGRAPERQVDTYALLLRLEELESLREELEELDTLVPTGQNAIPAELRTTMERHGLQDYPQLLEAIRRLHRQLDGDEA